MEKRKRSPVAVDLSLPILLRKVDLVGIHTVREITNFIHDCNIQIYLMNQSQKALTHQHLLPVHKVKQSQTAIHESLTSMTV